MQINDIQNLLQHVGIIKKKYDDFAEITGENFNVFDILNVNSNELSHSLFVAYLLNAKAKHGQKDKFLKLFLKQLNNKFENNEKNKILSTFKTETSHASTEKSIGNKTEDVSNGGRIDIILNDGDHNIIIENKIYASDQEKQMIRYHHYDPKAPLIYLSLGDEIPSKDSVTHQDKELKEKVDYISISYKVDIKKWIEDCIKEVNDKPLIRETLRQYVYLINELTNQDMNTLNKQEITEVLSKIENLRAAKVVYQNYSASFNYLAEKYFNPKMKEFANDIGMEFEFKMSEEMFIQFNLTNLNWNGKYWIGFTFENNSCLYGLCNNLNEYRISDENRYKLHENLSKLNITGKKSDWWPFYAQFSNLSIDTWEDNIIKSNVFFEDCKNKIETLLTAMKGINL